MLEILMVVGIIGIIMGLGAVSYTNQVNKNKVETTTIKVESMLKQARQMSIAARVSRRVAIDLGEEINGVDDDQDGKIDEAGEIWIEGKKSELKYYADSANLEEISDRERLVDGVIVADVDGQFTRNLKKLLYIEFNSRGQVDNVYFEGGEKNPPNTIAPVLHITRSGESFDIDDGSSSTSYKYWDLNTGICAKTGFTVSDTDPQIKKRKIATTLQRYKVQTLEVVRLTGRTRRYEYAVFSPWPNDHPGAN